MGKFVIKKTSTGFKFDLKASNGEVISTSEVYASKASCKKGINSVITNAPIAKKEDQTVKDFVTEKNPKFEIYKDKGTGFRFRLKAKNGQTIAVSQGYKTKKACDNGLKGVIKNVDQAIVEEVIEEK